MPHEGGRPRAGSNATAEERGARYPCDTYLTVPYEGWVRAIDVNAPPDVLYCWVCQLRVAPYSYDWIDNGGRLSARELTPGVDELAVGQPFLVFRLVAFESGRRLSGVVRPPFDRIFGQLAITYLVEPRPGDRSRLVVRLDVGAHGAFQQLRRSLNAEPGTVTGHRFAQCFGKLPQLSTMRNALLVTGEPLPVDFAKSRRKGGAR